MFWKLFAFLACFVSDPLAIEQRQVEILKATSAEIVEQPEAGVIILAEELESEKSYAVELSISDQPNDYIEIYRLIEIDGLKLAKFPPISLSAYRTTEESKKYLVTGKAGESVGVAVRSSQAPQWLEITIAPDVVDKPEPPEDEKPEDPSGDLSSAEIQELQELAESALADTGDKLTGESLAASLTDYAGKTFDDVTAALSALREAIEAGLLDSDAVPPYKDWKSVFREPLDGFLTRLNDDVRLSQDVLAKVAETLAETLSQADKAARQIKRDGTIVLYSSSGCAACENWKRSIYRPILKPLGWELEELQASGIPTPAFEIKAYGKRSAMFVGWLTGERLSRLLQALQDSKL